MSNTQTVYRRWQDNPRSPTEILEERLKEAKRGRKWQDNPRSPTEVLEERLKEAKRGRDWRHLFRDLFITATVIFLLFGFVGGVAFVSGASMEPSIHSGDIALFYRLAVNYNRGDVVILDALGKKEYVKRVIAVAGDTIDIDDETGTVLINNTPINEPYIYAETHIREGDVQLPLVVPEGCVWVLGDNRDVSEDSRELGMIDTTRITGRVFFIMRFS